ncbi:L,D-transpeptidase family protein [Sulfurimonas sp.]|nr:L,D-transpeptidase family protein [Sulfurimonas sp.]
MLKSFLILIIINTFLYSNNQIILVVSADFDSPEATLSSFENNKKVFQDFKVNIGKNGLGWGIGKTALTKEKNEPLKYEGDKKAPLGIFTLSHVFGYKNKIKINMPYLHATKELICVDDSNSKYYNKIINIQEEKPNSFEYMRRDDLQYELGIIVEHNKNQKKKRGSCIFLHVEKSKGSSTAGCTSMNYDNMKKLVEWLDESKNPTLIQITKSQLDQVYKLYPKLKYAK